MSNEEEKRCPLCAEEMDWTDQQLKPCKCGYQVCVWCWHHIMDMAEKDGTEGRCPACRTPYDKEKIVGMEANFERVTSANSNRKHKPQKAKTKTNEGKKDLTDVRVIQRKMAYVIGLPLSLADEDLLQRKEYFGQYGKVAKVSLSRTAGGAIQQFVNDTCSVYITYSKEEEAVRCIQSVHGFLLEGRFLRASFGTAKYCHAWLRNMPCNNPSCLYLHSIGAEEDSFGKDEVAAVHTRSRVQQIIGATHNMHRQSGNMLPPPVDELFNNSSTSSTDKCFLKSASKDAAHASVTSSGHFICSLSSKDNDVGGRTANRMTTFVDVVGRSCNSGPEKDGSIVEDRRISNLCSELSSVTINKDGHVEAECSNAMLCRASSSSHLVNGLARNKEFKEPFREPLILSALGRADSTPSDTAVTKEQSILVYDSGRQLQHGPCSVVREELLAFDDQRLKESDRLGQMASLFSSSYPAMMSEDSSDHAWRHKECSLSDSNVDHNTVHNHVDEDSIQFRCVNSVLNDGCNERKFQRSVKSDRIYRCSNSFSNEEIVEHLRRLDDGTNDDENSALDAVESSIISNILSMDFDAGDDSSNLRCASAGLFDENDGRHNASWNFHNSDQSRFLFGKQEGFVGQLTDVGSPFGNIGQVSKNCSVLQDGREYKEHCLHKPQYNASRAPSLTPPGFSVPSREPPPGFSVNEKTNQAVFATSGSHLVKNSLSSNNHFRTSSTGSSSNTGDVDFNDPAILIVGNGKATNGLNNSVLDMRPAYTPQSSALDEEARLWFLMQQSTNLQQNPKFSQIYTQQASSAHQELRYSAHVGDGFFPPDDYYGISSRLMDQRQTYGPSSFTQLSEEKYSNGHISNGYQPGLIDVQHRNEVGMAGLQRNERLGLNRFYPGYGDLMFQMPSSGDVYTRVFGM